MRVFHWLLAATFVGAMLTAESETVRDVHVALGYAFAGLLAFRLLWGFAGTRYARFSSFAHGPRAVLAYLRSLFTRDPDHHVGHNPAGAWAIFAMLALGAVTAASGYAVYEASGGRWLEELHEGAAHALLALVFLHVAGVVVASFLHRENLAAAMVTGRKRGHPSQAIAGTRAATAAVLAAVVATLGLGAHVAPPGAGEERAGAAAHHDADHVSGAARHRRGDGDT